MLILCKLIYQHWSDQIQNRSTKVLNINNGKLQTLTSAFIQVEKLSSYLNSVTQWTTCWAFEVKHTGLKFQ